MLIHFPSFLFSPGYQQLQLVVPVEQVSPRLQIHRNQKVRSLYRYFHSYERDYPKVLGFPKNITSLHVLYVMHCITTIFTKMKLHLLLSKVLIFIGTTATSLVAQAQAGQDTTKSLKLDEVEVSGKSKATNKTLLSAELSASPASVSTLGRDYVAKQAVNTYGDLLRPIVGVNVSNYQLGGVGYGIQMRGYVVTEHARDIAFTIDGVPQNQTSSLQANGYVDLNPLIPDIVKSIEVVRGPFSPLYGDHALGGGISFRTENKQPTSILISGGTYGNLRAMGTYGFEKGENSGYITLDAGRSTGYRNNSKEKHLNGLAKYTFGLGNGVASIRAQAFGSDFGSASYLVRSQVDSGLVSKKASVSNSDGGYTRQQNLVFNYQTNDTANYRVVTAYIQHHDFVRIRTGKLGGAQTKGCDNRIWTGFDVRNVRSLKLGNMPVLTYVGLAFRADFSDQSRFVTQDRVELSQNRDRNVNIYNPAAYAQVQLKPVDRLKLTLSVRYDALFYDIKTGLKDAEIADTSVTANAGAFSPKFGVAYEIAQGFSIYANAARGFKSPSGYEDLPFNANLKPSVLDSYELGISGDNDNGTLHGLVAGYISNQSREIGVDPLNNLLNFGKTQRSGIEAEGKIDFGRKSGLSIYANYTQVVAKLKNDVVGDDFVVNTPTYMGMLGVDYDFSKAKMLNNRIVLSIYDQLIGPKNLTADGKVQSKAFQRISGKLTYSRGSWANFRIYLQGSFYPGDGALEEASFYSGGALLVAPQAPFTFEGGIKVPF